MKLVPKRRGIDASEKPEKHDKTISTAERVGGQKGRQQQLMMEIGSNSNGDICVLVMIRDRNGLLYYTV